MAAIDYLSGDFVTEAIELEQVRRIATESLNTLATYRDQGAWPYEIVDKQVPLPARWGTDRAGWSHSTAAMILFAMGVACGRIVSSTLAPFVSPIPDSKHYEYRAAFDEQLDQFLKAVDDDIARSNAASGVATDGWHTRSATYGADDPFTLLWVLEICRDLRGDVSDELRARALSRYTDLVRIAVKRVTAVFAADAKPWELAFNLPVAEGKVNDKESIEHSFPTLRMVQLYDHLRTAMNSKAAAPDDANVPAVPMTELPKSEYLARYLLERLHLHLSYSTILDSSYDAAELAFTMEALLLLDDELIDAATIARCRHVLVETQKANAYLRPLRPFLVTPQGMVLLPLSVETANSLVRSCEILARRDGSQADRSGDAALFKRYTGWLFGRIVHGKTEKTKEFVGWRSEHADERGKVHTWETSQVLLYLLQHESFLRKYRAERSVQCMNLKVMYPATLVRRRELPLAQTPLAIWNEDVLEPLTSVPKYAIMADIGNKFIGPRSMATSQTKPAFSMLFYGPQGTGKTFLAKRIAKSLGWPLISISPSDFMVSGDSLVEARAKQLFDVLNAQSQTVILLDEIDRLILDRTSERYGKQSDPFQLMTPGMLTKLQSLRDEARSIFIISTNYSERIDSAIKRAGRIDEQYLVLPPETTQRTETFVRAFKSAFAKAERPEEMVPTADELSTSVRETVLWVISEIQNLVEAVAESWRIKQRNKESWSREQALAKLEDLIPERPPAIRIGEYVARFDDEKNAAGHASLEQKPFEEALMLLYLIAESGRDAKEDEKTLWRKIIGTGSYSVPKMEPVDVVKEHMKSQAVRHKIYETFDRAMFARDRS